MRSSIATDAVKLSISKMITMAISMVTAMLLSRFRTLEEYGTYSQLLLVINLVTTLFMVGLPGSINYFIGRAESKEEKERFISVYYTLSTLNGFISGLALVLSVPIIISYFENPLINNFIYYIAVIPWTKIIMAGIDNLLIVYHRTTRVMMFRTLNSLSILGTIVFVQLLDLSFSIYMILFTIVEAAFTVAVYLITRNTAGKFSISFDRRIIKSILSFSVPLGLASVVGILNIELDKLLIGRFFSTEDLAIYSNAAKELPATIIAGVITTVLMPRLVVLLKNNDNKKAISLWGSSIVISYAIICFFAAGLFVFAPEAISFLYSEKYIPGTGVFRIYSIVLLLRATYFGIILNSTGKTKFIFYTSLVSLGMNFVLNYVFYLWLGFIGPAIATFISIAFIQLLQLIATSIQLKVKFSAIFPWKALGLLTFLNALLGVGFATLKEIIPLGKYIGNVAQAFVLGTVWMIVYLAITYRSIVKRWHILNEKYTA